MKFLSKLTSKSHNAKKSRSARRLGFEQLEGRDLMATLGGIFDPNPPKGAPDRGTISQGYISFNSTTAAVTIDGTDAYNDTVKITLDNKGTTSIFDDTITVVLSNFGRPIVGTYNFASVSRIVFNGYGGNDFLDNQTPTRLTAYAGAGNDVILGGLGDDSLLGGDGDDYLDGRAGADLIFGEGGSDGLFGDDGIDSLYGGLSDDRLFAGNGDDYLYGEAGNDRLYGGAGLDNLLDTSGVNNLYTDYGPVYTVSASALQGFDFFDRNLKDPTVRSLARLGCRNTVLDRADMLIIYQTIAIDGTVTANELSDLKTMNSTLLNMPADTRFFANRITNGDPANAHYQGAALGNLYAGSTGMQLNKLVDKWFKGGDMPAIGDTGGKLVFYQYSYGSLFVDGPTFTDVNQGQEGDCYLISALGVIAMRSPSTIVNMFTDNGDGTWTVRFNRSGTPAYVTVNRMLPSTSLGEPYFADWGYQKELWVALAEKAYAQLNESGWIGQDGTNSYAGLWGGLTSVVFNQITGRSATNHSLGLLWNGYTYSLPTASDMINAFNGGQAITLSSKSNPASSEVVGPHAYMLTGYDPTTGKFELRNPWGYGGGSMYPTIITLSWAEILTNFNTWTSVLI